MSRLYKRRSRRKSFMIFVLFMLVPLLLLSLFYFGFDSVIRSALLLSSGTNRSQNESAKMTEDFYGVIHLDSPSVATNAASLMISGTVQGCDIVDVYLNNVKVSTVKVDEKDEVFEEKINTLKLGENEIYVKGRKSKSDDSVKSEKFTVLYKDSEPILEIVSPRDGDTLREASIRVIGNTDRGNTVHVNTTPIVVDLSGEFDFPIKLKEGENTLEFVATDIAQNTTSSTIRVSVDTSH